MLLNVGGMVMEFHRHQLLRCGLRGTCLAVLLNRFPGWLLTDAEGVHFVDADPFYFIWFTVMLYLGDRIDVSEICEGCPSAFPFYHDRFFAKTDLNTEPQTGDHEGDAFRQFMAEMGAFIHSSAGGTSGSEVLTARVDDLTVATTDATLDDFDTLHERFSKYRGPVVDVSADHLRKIVDYLRRIRIASDAAIPLPTSTSPGELLYACEMYGLMEQVYLSMIGKSHSHIQCILKSSHDDCEFHTLVQRAEGLQGGLLFVVESEREARRHRFACHIDGPLIAPSDPTAELCTGCPVTFYSISGAFEEADGIVKIAIPNDQQWMTVAGTQGTVTNTDGVLHCKVAIGGGRLWLGCAKDRPAGDLRRCAQWVKRIELPVGKTYRGGFFHDNGYATLATSFGFTCADMEIYTLQPDCGWEWLRAVADVLLSPST
ncbi:unnamed protein product [Vitrella brassicaformis CCMP3155]|uniref:Potassium channel tetramerisation-type BTB domain-containing protein n=1 Tax=Vitrella brassicaformis (strain CCMP3155) TaxID=1169540 RepID=A0A0G4EG77_VITBC|nr:unnamed protein product [Vitrella brassicaformis CCMP3155]|eukprot:CEL94480.1 unnamed protein product [Vitrella brassicaformis CCMP3155]